MVPRGWVKIVSQLSAYRIKLLHFNKLTQRAAQTLFYWGPCITPMSNYYHRGVIWQNLNFGMRPSVFESVLTEPSLPTEQCGPCPGCSWQLPASPSPVFCTIALLDHSESHQAISVSFEAQCAPGRGLLHIIKVVRGNLVAYFLKDFHRHRPFWIIDKIPQILPEIHARELSSLYISEHLFLPAMN